ncbi:MarR family winged helix-turn-helix transcriptional regulator [Blastococcus sp. TF02A-30]|uniref:MarR family winged helix-turn-helix transcriptional regulator n=1 Tax=Blastococcus sp. TF02A-30 TaxID=2250580 RepID=UPI000DEADEA7|nr:MarR family transcriptional regulator [Blastococcus sp. TF02A-30]RBY92900.1 MarR family transcriptional regulator [Blastococcus sp. TF02A-30]
MPLTPATRDQLLTSLERLIRTGRHVGARAASQLYGELPSFGWALLVPLQREGDQRCSELAARAGIDVSVASRQLGALARAGFVDRRPDPRDGRASLFNLTGQGADALSAARALRADWALSALSSWDEADAKLLTDLVDRLVVDLTSAAPPPASSRSAAALPG